MRFSPGLKALLTFGLALRLHHHFHGSPVDYAGLALAAAASWIGVPGPGEPVLIGAALLASKHKLDIGSVILVAWASATVGGVGGWLIGMGAGRRVLTTRGPFHRTRRAALARGEAVFTRYPVAAILLTPSWIAGILRVRSAIYLPTNAAGAALWAAGIGLGAYFAGPTVVDVVGDLGTASAIALAALIVVAVGGEVMRRRRARGRRQESSAPEA